MTGLQGKTAIMTGAGSRIGEAIARELATGGASIVVTNLEGAAAELVAGDRISGGGTAGALASVKSAGGSIANMAGRLGKPEQVAALTCFLLSDRASFITGSYHLVDGAHTAR